MKSRISGKEAVYVARESDKRRPIKLLAPEGVEQQAVAPIQSDLAEQAREAPPRVLKPSALNDQCLAPTPDLESHRKRLREAFGNTMSDEFVDVLLGKLAEALRPGPFDALEEATMKPPWRSFIQCNRNPNCRRFWQCRSLRRVFPGYDCFDRANNR